MGGVVAEIGAESEGGVAEKIRADVTVGIESDRRHITQMRWGGREGGAGKKRGRRLCGRAGEGAQLY